MRVTVYPFYIHARSHSRCESANFAYNPIPFRFDCESSLIPKIAKTEISSDFLLIWTAFICSDLYSETMKFRVISRVVIDCSLEL